MKAFLIINVIALIAATMAAVILIGDLGSGLFIIGIVTLMLVSGSLSAWLWYKRGKIYEERGESGPDG